MHLGTFFFFGKERKKYECNGGATFDGIDCNFVRSTYNLEAYIRTCDVNGNVTTACYRSRIKWVRSIIVNYPSLLQMLRLALDFAARQKTEGDV